MHGRTMRKRVLFFFRYALMRRQLYIAIYTRCMEQRIL